jgi:hypothetical protein
MANGLTTKPPPRAAARALQRQERKLSGEKAQVIS